MSNEMKVEKLMRNENLTLSFMKIWDMEMKIKQVEARGRKSDVVYFIKKFQPHVNKKTVKALLLKQDVSSWENAEELAS